MASEAQQRRACGCRDCGIDVATIGEVFDLFADVVQEAFRNKKRPPRHLKPYCVGCIERRLGRTLDPADFSEDGLNLPLRLGGGLASLVKVHWNPEIHAKSERLLSRLGSPEQIQARIHRQLREERLADRGPYLRVTPEVAQQMRERGELVGTRVSVRPNSRRSALWLLAREQSPPRIDAVGIAL